MTRLVDVLRKARLNAYLTFFGSVLARLLIAAGQPEQARARLDTALQLARDTGMHYYDAELLRLRAQTDPGPAAPTSAPPLTWPAARARTCSSCAPPSMISSYAVSRACSGR